MDINDKIAQRRKELEAQRAIDEPVEKEIVRQAVEKNLIDSGHQQLPPENPSGTQQPPAHLQQAIAAETEKALNALAVKSFTKFDWLEVGFLVLSGAASVFAVWWVGLALMAWGIYLFNAKAKFYVHHMKIKAEKLRLSREAEEAPSWSQPSSEINGFKYAKKRPTTEPPQ